MSNIYKIRLSGGYLTEQTDKGHDTLQTITTDRSSMYFFRRLILLGNIHRGPSLAVPNLVRQYTV